jgi:hypothetical protein
MDPNPLDAGIGSIIGGILIVAGLALAVIVVGVFIAAQFRRGRVNEETTITFPDEPQSADDRREVAAVEQREREVGGATAVAGGGRPVRQSPSRAERPVDAAHERGVDPAGDAASSGEGRPTRNPL